MLQRRALFLIALMLLVPLSGCLGGGGDDEPADTTDPVDTLSDEWMVYSVADSSELPACNSDTLGRLYHVEADAAFQVCTTLGWSFIDLRGDAGPPGEDGADGAPGAKGDDGEAGDQGAPGDAGPKGDAGEAGEAGQDGDQGPQGLSALASTTAFSGAMHGCAEGGVLVEVGVDSDADGILDAEEITSQSAVCNGIATETTPRTDAWLTKVTVEHFVVMQRSPHATCVEYRVIEQGFDNGQAAGSAGNGMLDGDEVSVQTDMCVEVDRTNRIASSYGADRSSFVIGDRIIFLEDTYGGASDRSVKVYDTTEADGAQYTMSDNVVALSSNIGDEVFYVHESNEPTLRKHNLSTKSSTIISGVSPALIDPSTGTSTTDFAVIGSNLYFVANDTYGHELWTYNAATDQTARVMDINPGAASSNPDGLQVLGQTLYFSATTVNHGNELWAHHPANATTWRITDLNPLSSSSTPTCLDVVHGSLFFAAEDGTSGYEWWIHTPVNGTTWQLADINPGSGDGIDPEDQCNHWNEGLAASGPYVLLAADDGTNGREMYAYHTATHGITQHALNNETAGYANTWDSSGFSNPRYFVEHDGLMYFSARSGAHFENYFSFDPSTDSVSSVFNISAYVESTEFTPGIGDSTARGIIPYKGSLLFSYLYFEMGGLNDYDSTVAIDDDGTVVHVLNDARTLVSSTNINGDTFLFTDLGVFEIVEETLVLAE
ncbi:MAG: DUF7151 family protein [Candidatus Poseidoniaceae archaeon]